MTFIPPLPPPTVLPPKTEPVSVLAGELNRAVPGVVGIVAVEAIDGAGEAEREPGGVRVERNNDAAAEDGVADRRRSGPVPGRNGRETSDWAGGGCWRGLAEEEVGLLVFSVPDCRCCWRGSLMAEAAMGSDWIDSARGSSSAGCMGS